MASVISPIGVGSFIKEHNRIAESRRDISKWFLDELLTIDFGEYIGRPSSLITLQKEYLTRFLENGWSISSVARITEAGRWTNTQTTTRTGTTSGESSTVTGESGTTSTSGTTTTNGSSSASTESVGSTSGSESGSTTSSSTSTSTSSSGTYGSTSSNKSSGSSSTSTSEATFSSQTSNSSSSTSESSSGTTSNASAQNTTSTSGSATHSDESTKNTESGATTSQTTQAGSETTTEDGTSTVESDGDAYWATVQRITLRRRRMQPELVLQDMIDSYVIERNEGVANEDARFNEMVTLYGVWLNRNETEGNAIITDALDVTGLFDKLNESIWKNWSAANNNAMELGTVAVEGNVAEIKYKYEALIARTRSEMIGQGTYNGTVWPTVEAGILRQMEAAIAEAKTTGLNTAVTAQVSVLNAKGDVMAQLVSAKNSIAAAIDNRKVTAIELRNTVMQAMLNFIGSREDAFPQIQEISNLASQIGFSVGSAGNVL